MSVLPQAVLKELGLRRILGSIGISVTYALHHMPTRSVREEALSC